MKRGKHGHREGTISEGFTLIELLVVIAIIGIILAILIVNIMAAQSQARDETRLENIASLQLALGLYFSKYGSYPAVIYCQLGVNTPTCLTGTASDNFIACVPNNPGNVCAPIDPSGSEYYYAAISYVSSGATPVCGGYHIGAQLENSNTHLTDAAKFDSTGATVCTGSNPGFSAASVSAANNNINPALFYDKTSTSPTT